jgi:hypothetical protein
MANTTSVGEASFCLPHRQGGGDAAGRSPVAEGAAWELAREGEADRDLVSSVSCLVSTNLSPPFQVWLTRA